MSYKLLIINCRLSPVKAAKLIINCLRKIYQAGFIMAFCFVVISCQKEEKDPLDNQGTFDVLVLNEGLWNMNNASITAYNTVTGNSIADIYTYVNNNRKLGDLANDMQVYGSKIYVAITTSSLIDVMNAETTTSIKQIPLFTNDIAAQPRQIACHNGKIYVCCFDGSVVKIDTSSLQIEATATAGRNPDGICVANNKLYVSNSGGLNYPYYDSTVSVFDLNTFTETKKITVKINPATIKADEYGNIYVISKGDYEKITPCLQKINTVTDQIEQVFEMEIAGFDIYNNSMYFYTYDYSSGKSLYQIFDLLSNTITNTNFITENSFPKTPYGIDVNPHNGDIYITDALDYTSTGDVYCFSKEGKKKFQFEAGMIPKKVIVKR
jgi:hypothetical protein